MARLGPQALAGLRNIDTPQYDRDSLQAGQVHIGVGGFFKAHQARYTDDVLHDGPADWGIIGASLQSQTAADQLNPQQGLYAVQERGPDTAPTRIIGALQRVICAAEARGYEELLNTLADPRIHLATLTVTEKAYCDNGRGLDTELPVIQSDLTTTGPAASLPGVLVAALERRRARGSAPITLLSCDNLAANGRVLERVVTQFAAQRAPSLTDWIAQHVTFPCSMVDRIVPATTEADRDAFAARHDIRDEALSICEPFRQWVIEDRFAGPRPAWENAGALLTDDVAAFESTKLRLLNGPHSVCAYVGMMAGHTHVHEVMGDARLGLYLYHLVHNEVQPVVQAPPGLDADAYITSVFARFSNPEIAYATRQVGSDGSRKLPQRWIPVIDANLAAQRPMPGLALAVAAWIEHLREPAPDPDAAHLAALYQASNTSADLVQTIFATPVFEGLTQPHDAFIGDVVGALTRLREHGVYAALPYSA